MTHEQILTEFKHCSEVLWNASKMLELVKILMDAEG